MTVHKSPDTAVLTNSRHWKLAYYILYSKENIEGGIKNWASYVEYKLLNSPKGKHVIIKAFASIYLVLHVHVASKNDIVSIWN